jgi:SAM-dependent methyltransferase
VFGRDPSGYDRARLGYPERVYTELARRCGLGAGTRALEIGPGTGHVTRRLLRAGVGSVTLVEPDRRLVRYLRGRLPTGTGRITFVARPFERAVLPPPPYDLAVAGSSFHWLPPRRSLRKIARALRSGGWWAHWNNHHGDPYRPTPFHRALEELYRADGGRPTSFADQRAEDARSVRRRLADLRAIGAFDRITVERIHWEATVPTARAVALWASFSDVLTRPRRDRERFLNGLARIVDDRFGGRARISMLTPLYTARRI